ncbi:hypothetical protein [Flavobacterium sp.]|jgi:phage terminase small subunit|uniref:hypothetical protein n=1 Tax=Flavobacterium sp. TaxID=239 RepID=UPI0037C06527
MAEPKLTAKEEKFCLEVATGVDEFDKPISYAEAYRRAYNAGKMKPDTVDVKASQMMAKDKIAVRVRNLRDNIAKKAAITVESLLVELEEARQAALSAETVQSSAAVSATMSKAKLLGLDKQLIDVTHRIVDDGSNEW